jgi:uncharacterized protein (TIGR03437 family)
VYHADPDYPGKMLIPQYLYALEERAQNGVRREPVPDSCGGARRPLCASSWLRVLPLICFAFPVAGQTLNQLELQQTRYELRMGEPTPILASSETLDFLSAAKTRTIETRRVEAAGAEPKGIVVGPDRTGRMVLAASPLAKPGNYSVTVSATSATGEQRQAVMDVTVASLPTVPSSSTRNPVVLLNGWETGFTNSCPMSSSSADTFGNLAQYLNDDGVPVVYLFDNCLIDPNQTIETLGNDLAAFLNSIQYDTGAQVPQIDLVAFSLGGLIARAYLAGLQPNQTLTPPTNTLVGKLVLIASPNFGSFAAGNYANSLTPGTQSAELIPGSSFLWNLANWNQRTDDLRGVSAIAVIGNAGTYLPNLSSTIQLNNASDGLVSLTSASAGFVTEQAPVTRIVPYCHVDPAAFTNTTILGVFACNAPGIANVTSESQYTGEIVRSFLGGTSDWTTIGTTSATDPVLSTNGGMFFGLVSATNAYASDLTQVAWGTVNMVNGGDISTIYYDDLIAGTGVFEAASTSLGTVACGPYTLALGYFSAVRCKINAAILSIGPLLTTFPRVVSAGGTITIAGANFGGSQCKGCEVVAIPAGSTTGQILQISSWKNTAITAVLPATLTGFVTITVYAASGTDAMAIMAALPNPSIIAVSPASLQFSYTTGSTTGGSVPAAQSIQITNSGAGTLAWTATMSTAWLSASPSSGTAPSTLSVSVSPAGLSAGIYTGNIQIASSGASNTPLSVPVTLTVVQALPSLAVAPQALTFNYSVGDSAPAAQTVSIANAGGGALNWMASTNGEYWIAVSPASGDAPGTLSISINPANLAAGTYTTTVQVAAAGATGGPTSISITLVVQGTLPVPIVAAVTNNGSFLPGAASATWLAIFGSNLSTSTYTWQTSDFVNGQLPTSLEGVSVTINGVAAFIEYISPTQINIVAPDDPTTGPVQVQVTAGQQASNSLTVQKTEFFPALLTIDNGLYVAALHADYALVGSPDLLPGLTSRPAQPGETISLYGTGFGPTDPATPTAQLVTTSAELANLVQVTIGGANAEVTYAGLVGSATYQINVMVPSLPNGDAPVIATIGGFSSQIGVSITVQQ